MDRRHTESSLLAATAFFALTAAFAQTPDPTLPEDANDEQTMVPENADDDEGDLAPEDGDDTAATAQSTPPAETPAPADAPAPTVTPTPTAAPIRRAEAPLPSGPASPTNILILAGDVPADGTDPLRGGCWLRLHEAPNFSGSTLTFVGPADMPELTGPFGMEWEDRIGSLEVGPSATVRVFSDDDFEGTETLFGSGRRAADIADEFESLRIACGRSATG